MKTILILSALLFLCHCGVKGDPVPPATPAEYSHGPQPSVNQEKSVPPASQKNFNNNNTDDSDENYF